jgi:hypothetical protein
MKSKKKKGCLFVLIGFAAIILVMVIVMLLNPLRRSEERIREDLLKVTPIGTDMQRARFDSPGKVVAVSETSGYSMLHGRPNGPSSSVPFSEQNIIGVKYIKVWLGHYNPIFITDVIAYYAFDEDSKLIDIAVRKDKDGL